MAVALAPIAERMELGREELRDPQRASSFWNRFWEDRSLDFRQEAVKRLISRYLRQPGELRQKDLVALDTYAVGPLMAELEVDHTIDDKRLLLKLVARATGRHAWRPAHFHFMILAEGHRPLATEIFPDDDPYIDEDAVFGVRDRLAVKLVAETDPSAVPVALAARDRLKRPFYRVEYDFRI